jgi:tetratricopeptide (TPR) repeat protein
MMHQSNSEGGDGELFSRGFVRGCWQLGFLGLVCAVLAVQAKETVPPGADPAQAALYTEEQLSILLRRAQFPQLLRGAEQLLVSKPEARVHGLLAVAYAAADDADRSKASLEKARAAQEAQLDLLDWNARALSLRSAKKLEEAADACRQAIALDPRHPLAYVTFGAVCYDQKKYELASRYVLQAAGIEPALPFAQTLVGMIAQAQGKLDEAIAAYRKAKELDPADLRPSIGLVEVFSRQRRFGPALQVADSILGLKPELHLVREMRAAALVELGRSADALREAQAVLEANSSSASASYTLSRAHAQQGDFKAALAQLSHLLNLRPDAPEALYLNGVCLLASQQVSQAKEAFTAALQRAPRFESPIAALGVIAHLAGDYEEAVRQFNQALAGANQAWQERLQFYVGNVRLSQKRWAQAKEHFVKGAGFLVNAQIDRLDLSPLYEGAPASAAASVNLGTLFLVEGFLDGAIEAYQRGLKEHPGNAIALFVLSNALARKLRFDEALDALNNLVRVAPGYVPAYFAIGEVHVSRQAHAEAIKSYGRVVELDPKHTAARTRLAALHQLRKDFKEAEAAYREVIKLSPDSPVAYNELANLLAEQEANLDEALRFAETAVRLASRSPVFLDTLGWVQHKAKDYSKAQQSYEAALKLEPDPALTSLVRYHLALVHQATNAADKALAEAKLALEAAPNAPHAAEVKALIQSLEPTEK